MTNWTKWITAGLALVALVAAASAIVWLGVLSNRMDFAAPVPTGDRPPHESWAIFIFFMKSGATLNVIYAGLLTILSAGIGRAAELYKKPGLIIAVAVLCIVGIIACTWLMSQMTNSDEKAEMLRWFAEYETLDQTRSAVNWVCGALIGWFTLFLGSQLGVSLVSRDGAAGQAVTRLRNWASGQ